MSFLGTIGKIAGAALGGIGGFLIGGPAGAIEGASLGLGLTGGIGGSSKQPQGLPELQQAGQRLQQQSAQLGAQGQQMRGYLESGTLPPGLQAGLTAAGAAAEAKTKSDYAARGMTGSSAEAQDVGAIPGRLQAESAKIATSLYQAGLQESQLANQLTLGQTSLYEYLINYSLQKDQNTQDAIMNFASALAGMGGGGSINNLFGSGGASLPAITMSGGEVSNPLGGTLDTTLPNFALG
jgi:hypothetical protein